MAQWAKIKKEYLEGMSPKELEAKYGTPAKSISNKAYEEDWTSKKQKISEEIEEISKERLLNLTNLALDKLEGVLNRDEIKDTDLISAIGKALDISGLKSSKVDNTIGVKPLTAEERKQIAKDFGFE